MATYSIPEGEQVRVIGKLGKGRRRKPPKVRKGPGKSPLVDKKPDYASRASSRRRPAATPPIASHAKRGSGRPLPTKAGSGKSAMAPGQRKKALGLKSAKTLAPGHTKHPRAPKPTKADIVGRRTTPPAAATAPSAAPRPGALSKIGSAAPRRKSPGKVGPHRGATMPAPSAAAPTAHPGVGTKFDVPRRRRQPPAKGKGRRLGIPGI